MFSILNELFLFFITGNKCHFVKVTKVHLTHLNFTAMGRYYPDQDNFKGFVLLYEVFSQRQEIMTK